MICSLPKGFLISTDNGDEDYFYLTTPSGVVIASGEDADELFVLARVGEIRPVSHPTIGSEPSWLKVTEKTVFLLAVSRNCW